MSIAVLCRLSAFWFVSFLTSVAFAAGPQSIPLGAHFHGAITDPTHPVAFAFEGIVGVKVTLEVRGSDGLRPVLKVLDEATGTQTLAIAESSAAGVATLSGFAPPTTARYLVEVSGSPAGPEGAFEGDLIGKLPKEMKSAKFPSDPLPGETIEFFALGGTTLSGKLRIWTKPHPASGWFVLLGPSGPIDAKFQTTYSGFNKFATLEKVVLPVTGTYRIGPSQPHFVLTGNVKMKPPKGGGVVVDIGDQPFIATLPAPQLAALPAATNATTVKLAGTALGATKVEIVADPALVVADVIDGEFSANVPLVSNSLNTIFVRALNDGGARSDASLARVVQDSEGPSISILTPLTNGTVGGATTHVSGVVFDRLSPAGISVKVNSVDATLVAGAGAQYTFERRDVTVNTLTTILSVQARDALGNLTTRSVSVKKVNTALAPTVTIVSGDGQGGSVGTELDAPLVAKLAFTGGIPMGGKLLEFSVSRGDGALGANPGFGVGESRLLVATDSNGQAAVRFRLGLDAGVGANRVAVRSVGIGAVSEFSFPATPGAPRFVTADAGRLQLAPAGTELPHELVTRVTDGRNPLADVAVRFQVRDGGGRIDGAAERTVFTDSLGRAIVRWRLGASAGAQRVVSTVAGIAPAATFDATALDTSLVATPRLGGTVHDLAHQALSGATVRVFRDGAPLATLTTDGSGRFAIPDVGTGSVLRIHVDGSTVTALGNPATGGTTPTTLRFGAAELPPLPLGRGSQHELPAPILLAPLATGTTIYNGSTSLGLVDPAIDDFSVTLAANTVITLENGTTVPGSGGSTPVGLAPLHLDDLPAALPGGRTPLLAFDLVPHGATFGTPLTLTAPNLGGAANGARAALLRYDARNGGYELVAHLTANGRTLQLETGLGIVRSGVHCIAISPPELGSRLDCAGLAVHSFEATLALVGARLDADAATPAKLGNAVDAVVAARAEWDSTLVTTTADATITNSEWSELRADAYALHNAISAADATGTPRELVEDALALDGGFAAAQLEASQASCGDAATVAELVAAEFAANAKGALLAADGSLALRESALTALDATSSALTSYLAAPSPPADAATTLTTTASSLATDSAGLATATEQYLAVLAADAPGALLLALAAELDASLASFTGTLGFEGAVVRAAGQLALGDRRGGLALHGLPADGIRRFATALHGGAGIGFARSAPFLVAQPSLAAPSGLALQSDPPPTALTTAITPNPLDLTAEGANGVLTLTASRAYGPALDATTAATGTTWGSSFAPALTVGPDGLATPVAPGTAHATAVHQDVVAARRTTVKGEYLVTLRGLVVTAPGIPAVGAIVTPSVGSPGTTGAAGTFAITTAVPSSAPTVSITVANSSGTQYAINSVSIDGDGDVDAGLFTLTTLANVAQAKPISAIVGPFNNALSLANNAIYPTTGTGWTSSNTVWWQGTAQIFEIDLQGSFTLFAANCMGDNNDTYQLDYFDPVAATWKPLWTVPDYSSYCCGLQTRPDPADNTKKTFFGKPVVGSKLRLQAVAGDNSYSIGELQVFGFTAN